MVTITGNRSVTAAFITSPLVKIGVIPYSSLTQAYSSAANGNIIQARENTFVGSFTLNRDVSLTLKGGYDSAYVNNNGYTALQGILSVERGSSIIERIVVK